jgi:anti-sigma B factor antagonist
MTTAPQFATHQSPDGTRVLTVSGEIDLGNVESFRAALAQAAAPDLPGNPPLLVDLTGVQYLDSAGLSVLFDHAGRIVLVAAALLRPVLAVSGLIDLVPVTIA